MHLPTPTLHSKKDETKKKKRQKRKASDTSTATSSEVKPATKKLTKKKTAEGGADTALSKRTTRGGDKMSPVHTIPGMGAALVPARASAATAASPDPTLRRSSRIKESVRKCNETWHRCRPYVERLNGTIMPLEHQGSKAYYQKDGVRT